MANRRSRPSPDAIGRALRMLARKIEGLELPAVEKISESQKQDPFQILISALLSARTKDATTLAASTRLFKKAPTAETVARLPVRRIEQLIFPVAFYRNKAVFVKEAAKQIVDKFGGAVPRTMEELITLPGVGRKTANLVLILAFRSEQNICVDIHVHRISNRLGWVVTRTPEETERALYETLDQRWWPVVNQLLVIWGQNVCRPVYPRCRECAIVTMCARRGVNA